MKEQPPHLPNLPVALNILDGPFAKSETEAVMYNIDGNTCLETLDC